jgi:uncharacterized protein YdeI (BOF family)
MVPASQIFEGERFMKKLIAVTAFTLVCGSALAQDKGPAPQSGMEKPGMTDGAKQNGAMNTTGMSTAKGNLKREKDGAPAPGKKNYMQK